MKKLFSALTKALITGLLSLVLFISPSNLHACACGCGVFDTGTLWNFPTGPGGMVYSEYAFSEQGHNWNNLGPSASANNGDKLIQTSWMIGGFQYFWNSDWYCNQISCSVRYREYMRSSSIEPLKYLSAANAPTYAVV